MLPVEDIVAGDPVGINITEISQTHVHFWRFGHIPVFVSVIIRNTVVDIKIRIVFKMLDQIFMEDHPVFAVQDQSAEPDRVSDKLHVILFCERTVFQIVFAALPDDFLHKMPWCLHTGTVRMKSRSLILIFNKFL